MKKVTFTMLRKHEHIHSVRFDPAAPEPGKPLSPIQNLYIFRTLLPAINDQTIKQITVTIEIP